jgi:hypothetical protein
MNKLTIPALIAISGVAVATPLHVCERQPNQPDAVHHGLVNGVPVLISIYGRDSIRASREYGRSLVLNHYSFAASKEMIRARAEQLYGDKGSQAVLWAERDAAAGYDEEVRHEK